MNARPQDRAQRAALSSRRVVVIALVVLYLPLLALVFLPISFSAVDEARAYVASVMQRPPQPLPPLPVMRSTAWPQVAVQRDPFLPVAAKASPARAATTATANPVPVASYADTGDNAYLIVRDAAGELARFGVGDAFDGGTIQHIESKRVILMLDGKQRAIDLRTHSP